MFKTDYKQIMSSQTTGWNLLQKQKSKSSISET